MSDCISLPSAAATIPIALPFPTSQPRRQPRPQRQRVDLARIIADAAAAARDPASRAFLEQAAWKTLTRRQREQGAPK